MDEMIFPSNKNSNASTGISQFCIAYLYMAIECSEKVIPHIGDLGIIQF